MMTIRVPVRMIARPHSIIPHRTYVPLPARLSNQSTGCSAYLISPVDTAHTIMLE